MTGTLLKDWTPTKMRSTTPSTAWPRRCSWRVRLTSRVVLLRSQPAPGSPPGPVSSDAASVPLMGCCAPGSALLSSDSQSLHPPAVSSLIFFSPKFQLFVTSRIHYWQHPTFVFVLCWGQGEQEGEFWSPPSHQVLGPWNPYSLGPTDERVLCMEKKVGNFLNPFWQLRWCTFKTFLYRYFVTKNMYFLLLFYLGNGTHFSICAGKKIQP